MGTFNCCRGRVKRTVPCTVPTPVAVVHPDKPERLFKRMLRAIKPVLPAVLLALVPKCPFCLAAYVALGTGLGLSVASAKLLHISLLCAGVIPLSLVAAKYIGAYFFPVTISGRRLQQQLFTGMTGILIGSGILLLF